jgi:hypothetical protein
MVTSLHIDLVYDIIRRYELPNSKNLSIRVLDLSAVCGHLLLPKIVVSLSEADKPNLLTTIDIERNTYADDLI